MPDENDIVYEAYQVDFIYIGRTLFDVLGLDQLSFRAFVSFLEMLWDVWTVLAFVISFLLIVGIIYAYIRQNQLNAIEQESLETQERLYRELYGTGAADNRWNGIENHIATENPNDWKLAIIEADVMLEETLDSAGYAGLTIGDKLKSASPTSFRTLEDAWKAHKVRNQIAHAGADFVLTKKLAQETITQYRRVFQEFGVV